MTEQSTLSKMRSKKKADPLDTGAFLFGEQGKKQVKTIPQISRVAAGVILSVTFIGGVYIGETGNKASASTPAQVTADAQGKVQAPPQ